MELAELGKTQALLIPTPGQTEQEYLSWYDKEKGWFYSEDQDHLDLCRRCGQDQRCIWVPGDAQDRG